MRMLSPSAIEGMPETWSGAARVVRPTEKTGIRHIYFMWLLDRGRCGAMSEGSIGGNPDPVLSAR